MAQEQGTFTSSWQERLTALKNLPPVLNIVWRSGRGVVTAGLVLRVFTSLQPIALLAVGKFIIDSDLPGSCQASAGSALLVVAGGG